MSLTDDMSINAMRKSKDVTRNAYNIMLKAAKAGKFIGGSGVVLVLKIKNLTWAYVHVDYGGRVNRYFWLNDGGEQFAISDVLDTVIKIKNSY